MPDIREWGGRGDAMLARMLDPALARRLMGADAWDTCLVQLNGTCLVHRPASAEPPTEGGGAGHHDDEL